MSDKTEDQNNEQSGNKSEETETFTKEQVEALISEKVGAIQKEYAGIQSGLQKKLDEALNLAKQKEDEGKTAEQKMLERLTALEKSNAQKDAEILHTKMVGIGQKMLGDASIPVPPHIDSLVGSDEETTRQRIGDFIEYQKSLTAESNKRRDSELGRTVTTKRDEPTSFDSLADMSEEELKLMSPEDIYRITHERLMKT